MRHLRFLFVVMGLAAFALLGMSGCKNVCEKAMDHMKGCFEEYCADREDDALCQAMEQEAGEEAVGECTEEAKAEAQTILDKSCDDLLGPLTGGGE